MTTYRRSNGARKTWKTHFTTGTSRTRRAGIANRPKLSLGMQVTEGTTEN